MNTENRNIIGIIPARMGSSRFYGKPLAEIMGMPMIEHVYSSSKKSKILKEVYIATPDKEIANFSKRINAKLMTKDTHQRASDRTAEALEKIEKKEDIKIDIVVMIQGDEVMVKSEMIDGAVSVMIEDETILVSNLMSKITDENEYRDINEIKVVIDSDNNALYFSRSSIPSDERVNVLPLVYKQVCVISFRRDFLLKFNSLAPTPLEEAESIDMLRVLEHGFKVKMIETKYHSVSVDTKEDLKKAEDLLSLKI